MMIECESVVQMRTVSCLIFYVSKIPASELVRLFICSFSLRKILILPCWLLVRYTQWANVSKNGVRNVFFLHHLRFSFVVLFVFCARRERERGNVHVILIWSHFWSMFIRWLFSCAPFVDYWIRFSFLTLLSWLKGFCLLLLMLFQAMAPLPFHIFCFVIFYQWFACTIFVWLKYNFFRDKSYNGFFSLSLSLCHFAMIPFFPLLCPSTMALLCMHYKNRRFSLHLVKWIRCEYMVYVITFLLSLNI